MWFIPPLRRDFFSNEVLSLRGEVKEFIEDGYLEYSFGGDGVWQKSWSFSLYYVRSQFDYIGVCFVKGFLFLIIISLICFIVAISAGSINVYVVSAYKEDFIVPCCYVLCSSSY